MATRAVRWNPLVLEPSITSFRITWICGIGVMPKSLCNREAEGERLIVERRGRLLIVLDKARGFVGVILELPHPLHLFLCGTVDLAHLALGRPQVPEELARVVGVIEQRGRAVAEEFLFCVQLLVDLDPLGHEADRPYNPWALLRMHSPLRSVVISAAAFSGSRSFPSTHICLTSATSGSMSPPSITPAASRSRPVS